MEVHGENKTKIIQDFKIVLKKILRVIASRPENRDSGSLCTLCSHFVEPSGSMVKKNRYVESFQVHRPRKKPPRQSRGTAQ